VIFKYEKKSKKLWPEEFAASFYLMGQCHEIFDLRFFSPINPTYGPDSRAKTVSHMASYSYPRLGWLVKKKPEVENLVTLSL
jgi:hypothetical protein